MIASAVLAALGLVSAVLLFLQPWASCPGVDDSSAGCPVEGAQVVVQQIAVLVLVVGVLGLVASSLARAGWRSIRG
ncbi:hypothetical protein [Kineococcus radiotolerans]|nr:hypothetical protein [Kineococcus radiotolerans]